MVIYNPLLHIHLINILIMYELSVVYYPEDRSQCVA